MIFSQEEIQILIDLINQTSFKGHDLDKVYPILKKLKEQVSGVTSP